MALNEKLLLGTTLKLQLNLPQATKPIFTEGSIVWTKEIAERFSSQKEERFFATGIKFTQLKVEDEAILKNFINQKVKSLK